MDIQIIDSNFGESISQFYEVEYEDLKFISEKSNIAVAIDGRIGELLESDIDKKIAWLLEPIEINRDAFNLVINNIDKFALVLTHSYEFARKYENCVYVPYATTWIKSPKIYDKTKLVSMFLSHKQFMEGHKLRHNIMREVRNGVDYFGITSRVSHKEIGLNDYMFSIVIENVKLPGWHTEKILDCFQTGTIPIYWGDPNITEFYHGNGILECNNIEEIKLCLEEINKNGLEIYNKRIDSIRDNFDISNLYTSAPLNVLRVLKGCLSYVYQL